MPVYAIWESGAWCINIFFFHLNGAELLSFCSLPYRNVNCALRCGFTPQLGSGPRPSVWMRGKHSEGWRQGRHAHTASPARLWSCTVEAATSQITPFFCIPQFTALFADGSVCQKGLYTTDREGVMLIPSGHWGVGYFWFTYCHYYLRSVSKQLAKILDGMFSSNSLLERVEEQWMGEILVCLLCYPSGCDKRFWRVKFLSTRLPLSLNRFLVLSLSCHGYHFSKQNNNI